jgi:hypothetical protein
MKIEEMVNYFPCWKLGIISFLSFPYLLSHFGDPEIIKIYISETPIEEKEGRS